MGNQINEIGKIPPKELGKGVRTPEGQRGLVIDKNDVLVDAGQCLTDYEIIASFRKIIVSAHIPI